MKPEDWPAGSAAYMVSDDRIATAMPLRFGAMDDLAGVDHAFAGRLIYFDVHPDPLFCRLGFHRWRWLSRLHLETPRVRRRRITKIDRVARVVTVGDRGPLEFVWRWYEDRRLRCARCLRPRHGQPTSSTIFLAAGSRP